MTVFRGSRIRGCRAGAVITACSISLAAPEPSIGQSGQVRERITSTSDSSQAYAVYLPPNYSTDRRWPVLFVLDPRGRAMLALQLFQPAAARHGWIVMSSYNSRSDGPPEPTLNAMEAMLRAAQDSLSINTSRLYLAGFSGTARAALRFAVTLRGHVAGVIATGGALGFELGGPETTFARDSTFGYFGAASVGDFNYEEVLIMGEQFGALGVPFRVAVFDGGHTWPPADVCGDAIDWLELRAVRGGLRATDSAWVTARLEAELDRAARLEREGQWHRALQLYEAIARDYPPGLRSRLALARAGELRNHQAVQRHQAKARRLAKDDLEQARELQKTLAWSRSEREMPSPEAFARKLRIADLQQLAARGDSLESASASRLLARIFVWLAYYEPRTYLQNRSPMRALSALETALKIGPIQGGESCALLRAALQAASRNQRTRFQGQCGS
jgi:predicted esterase